MQGDRLLSGYLILRNSYSDYSSTAYTVKFKPPTSDRQNSYKIDAKNNDSKYR